MQINSGHKVTQTKLIYPALTYPFFIFDGDISSFLNKGFHWVFMAFLSCNVYSGPLVERKISSNFRVGQIVL